MKQTQQITLTETERMGVNVPQVQAVVPGHLANPAPYPQPS